MTNGERIRSMTDEELTGWVLTEFICEDCVPVMDCDECRREAVKWFKQEVEE